MAELSRLPLADVRLVQGCSLTLLVARAEMDECLRRVLGRLTGRPPQSLQFETTAEGKPYLAGNGGEAIDAQLLLMNVEGWAIRAIPTWLRAIQPDDHRSRLLEEP